MDSEDERDEGKWVWPHPADLGVILIAGVFLAGMIGAVVFIFSSPEPIKDLFGKKQPQQNEVIIPLQQQK